MLEPRLLLDEPPEAVEPPQGEVAFGQCQPGGRRRHPAARRRQLRVFRSARMSRWSGPSNSGKNIVPQLLARLYTPTGGRITIGGTDLDTLPFAVSGRLVGYVGPATHLFSASMRDNLLLGLRTRPPSAERPTGERGRSARARIEEARRSGNHRARHRRRLDRLRSRPGWPMRRNWSAASSRSCGSSISTATSICSGCTAGSIRSVTREAAERLLEARRRFGERARRRTGSRALSSASTRTATTASASIARQSAVRHRRSGRPLTATALAENPYVGPRAARRPG